MNHGFLVALLLGMTGVTRGLVAQELRGVVTDSANRRPVPGAVVTLFDGAGATIGRNITNERGQYRVVATLRARRVRVVRMGFRPRELEVPLTSELLDITLVSLPTMLQEMRVIASASCPKRADRQAALALLEQARAGLLTSVVAREATPASMTILSYERTLRLEHDDVESQIVRVQTSEKVMTSFQAVRSAGEFVRHGFSSDTGGVRFYFGPDAHVLLDEAFSDGYCFHLRDRDRARPNQVGLAFQPASRRRNRVDVDGTLWIDTLARSLKTLEYRFLGLSVDTDPVRPGGHASFQEMANGVVFIDKWHFRLPAPIPDTSYSHSGDLRVRIFYVPREVGGEVATAHWPEDHSYQARLGALRGRLVDAGGNPSGITVQLLGTDYVASPDSLGHFEIHNLLPGPYVAYLLHPDLEPLNMLVPTSLRFVATPDSVQVADIRVPDPQQFIRGPHCASPLAFVPDPFISIDIETPDGRPVKNAHWQISKTVGEKWQRVMESRTTADGVVRHCMRIVPGDDIAIKAWRDGEFAVHGLVHVTKRGQTFTVTLPGRP
jgi:hypothetical protein